MNNKHTNNFLIFWMEKIRPHFALYAIASTEHAALILGFALQCCMWALRGHPGAFFCQWFIGNTIVAVYIPLCQLYHKYGGRHESHVRYFYPLSPSGKCGNFCFQTPFAFLFSTSVQRLQCLFSLWLLLEWPLWTSQCKLNLLKRERKRNW